MLTDDFCKDNGIGTSLILNDNEIEKLTSAELAIFVHYQKLDEKQFKYVFEKSIKDISYDLAYWCKTKFNDGQSDDFIGFLIESVSNSKGLYNFHCLYSIDLSLNILNKYFDKLIFSGISSFTKQTILNMDEAIIERIIGLDRFSLVKSICETYPFTKGFVQKNISDLNVIGLLANKSLDFDLTKMYSKKELACFKNEAKFLDRISRENWFTISKYKHTIAFIEKHKDKLIWSELVKFNDFSESFLNKHISYLDDKAMKDLAIYQKLSLTFIKSNLSKLERFSMTHYSKEELSQIKEMKSMYSDLF
jgi:hypothetical protein